MTQFAIVWEIHPPSDRSVPDIPIFQGKPDTAKSYARKLATRGVVTRISYFRTDTDPKPSRDDT